MALFEITTSSNLNSAMIINLMIKILKISSFVSPINTFSLVGNLIAYSSSQGTNREKFFNCITYKQKRPILA